MKRSLWVMALLVLTCVITLSACGGSNDSQTHGTGPDHVFGEWKTIKDATCTVKGEQERSCSCGEKETRTIDATGHSEVVDVAVAPTFTETGLTEGSHCGVCGTVMVAQEVVPAKPSKAELLSEALTVDGTNISGEVSHATDVFSFANDISVTNDSAWALSTDAYGLHTIVTKTAPLSEGNNTYYIHVTNPDTTVTTYTVNLYRKHMYTVSFDTDGGTGVDTQYVEEGSLAVAPSTTRVGYTFVSWSYDFSVPITSNVTVTAHWTANTGIDYKVEYYLQNADRNGYEEPIVVNLSGTTDATVNAEQKVFEHFTLNRSKSTLSGKIKGDGSLVLKVYYTRNTYTVSVGRNNASAGTVTGGGTYGYDKQITLIATTNTGYTFLGWYEKGALVSSNASYTVTVRENKTFEARWQVNTYTVSVSKNISGAGLVYGDGIYNYGSHVTVSAVTNTGYTFLGWYENGSLVSSSEYYTFALYTSDKALEARWKTNPYTGNESYNNDFQGIDLSRPDYDYDGDGVKDSHAMVALDGFRTDLGKGNVAVYDPEDATNIVWKIPMGTTKPGTDNTNNLNQALGISPSYTIDSNLLMEWNIYIPTGATGRVQYQFVTTESGWVELFNLDVNNAQILSGSGWMATAGKGMTMTRDEWHSIRYALNMVTGDWEMFLDGEFIAFGNLGCTYITVKDGYVIMGKVQTGYTGKGYILMDDIKINGGYNSDGDAGGLDSFVPSWYEQDFEEFEDGENISELFPNRASKNGEYEEQFVADVDGNKVWSVKSTQNSTTHGPT